MPTVNNRGRLFWGSAFGCEPRACPERSEGRGNSKRDAGLSGVALWPICGGERVTE
jgi:hypothetical protein